jgi:PKD repeat protein
MTTKKFWFISLIALAFMMALPVSGWENMVSGSVWMGNESANYANSYTKGDGTDNNTWTVANCGQYAPSGWYVFYFAHNASNIRIRREPAPHGWQNYTIRGVTYFVPQDVASSGLNWTVIPVGGRAGTSINISYPYGNRAEWANIRDIQDDGAPLLIPNFTATPLTGTAPLTVTFTDASTGSPTSWSWSFGDGQTSIEKNPSHTYEAVGTYDVSLTAANAGGSNATVKAGYVVVTAAPVQTQFYVYAEGSGLYPSGYGMLPEANQTPQQIYNLLDGKSGAADVDPNIHWVGRGLYRDRDSSESHWNTNEQASSYADNADFSVFAGHGSNTHIIFGTENTDTDLYRENMKFGGNRAKWVTFFACDVLNQSTEQNWTSVFNGLHILNGFNSDGELRAGQGTLYVNKMTGGGGGNEIKKSIIQSWKETLQESINLENISGGYMWAEPCEDDFLPGFGDYCPAPSKDSNGNPVVHLGPPFKCITS